MARTKSNDGQQTSRYWNPSKVGEEIKGKFTGFTVSEFKDGNNTRKQLSIGVGEKFVNVSTVLFGFIHPIWKKLKEDKSVLRIEFTGVGKKKKGRNPARLFKVWMDGKALVSEGAPVRKATKADIESVFPNF